MGKTDLIIKTAKYNSNLWSETDKIARFQPLVAAELILNSLKVGSFTFNAIVFQATKLFLMQIRDKNKVLQPLSLVI